MKCKKAERLISRSLDSRATDLEMEALEKHIEGCPTCRQKKEEYAFIAETLKEKDLPAVNPYFWERLQPRLKEGEKYVFWSVWKKWSIRAIPVSIIAVAVLALCFALFFPRPFDELSQTGDLLLSNTPALPETVTLLDAETGENKSIQLIFMAMEEKPDLRRYFP